MAITATQRNDVISLLVGMFDAAPSAALMTSFVADIEAGGTNATLAETLDDTAEFQSLYPVWLTDAEFATNFTTNLLDGHTSSSELATAIAAVESILAGGASRGQTANIAVDYLLNTAGTSDAVYGTAVQSLMNKVEVATYFATTQLDASSDFDSLQAVVANIDETSASVTAQKLLIDADLDSLSQSLTTGQDDLTGSAGNDAFTAWIFNNSNSAQSGDMIDGGAGTDTLIAEIGDSQDFAISLKTDSVEVAHFRAQAESTDSSDNDIQDGGTDGIDMGVQIDAQDMDGTVEFWSTESRANLTVEDVRENSNTVTLGWRNADAGDVNFETYFDTQHITAPSAVTADSQLFLELLDLEGMATDGEPLKDNPYIGVSFTMDGVTVEIAGPSAVQTTYADLVDALNAVLDAEGITTVTASLGSTFSAINSTDALSYDGTTIVLTNSGSETLGAGGWIADGPLPGDSNLHTTQSTTPPATTTELTQVDVIFDNVGRGSKAEDFVAGNISQGTNSGSQGIQQFNIDIDRDSWVDTVRSTNNTLEEVFLESIGSEGSVRIDDLNDVRVFDATAMDNSVTLTATLSDAVIAKYDNLKDSGSIGSTDNVEFEYDTAGSADTINLTVSEAAASYEDFELAVNTGAGDDTITLQVNDLGATLDANWLADQEALDNITITSGSGNDTINTFGAGSATINAGAGNDTIYSDNSGIDNQQATWLFNATNTDVNDILGSGAGLDRILYNAQLTVTFSPGSTGANVAIGDAVALDLGFESTVTIATTDYLGNAISVNQAIKAAINDDATLSEFLKAEDGPNNSLVVTSLVDGVYQVGDLDVSIAPATLATLTASEIAGLDSAWETRAGDSTIAAVADGDFITELAAVAVAGTGYDGTSKLAEGTATVATGTQTAAAVQTIDVSAVNLTAAGQTVDFEIDGTTVTFTSAGAVTADALEAAIAAALGATTVIDGIVYTVTNPGAGTGDLTFTQGAVKAIAPITADAAVTLTGVASDEGGNNNVINAGTGSDTIVLSTSAASMETIVFTGTGNGDVDVLNFTAGAAGDIIDFSAYLNTQVYAAGSTSTESINDVAITYATVAVGGALTVAANEVTVVTGFLGSTTETFDGLTGAVLLAALNAVNVANANDWGGAAVIGENTLESGGALANIVGTTRDHVVLIENEANDGQYKAFHLTSTEGTVDDFTTATLIGEIDLGDAAAWHVDNF